MDSRRIPVYASALGADVCPADRDDYIGYLQDWADSEDLDIVFVNGDETHVSMGSLTDEEDGDIERLRDNWLRDEAAYVEHGIACDADECPLIQAARQRHIGDWDTSAHGGGLGYGHFSPSAYLSVFEDTQEKEPRYYAWLGTFEDHDRARLTELYETRDEAADAAIRAEG